MNDVKNLIDFMFTSVYNALIAFQRDAPVWFYVSLTSVFFLPWLGRIVRSLRSSSK